MFLNQSNLEETGLQTSCFIKHVFYRYFTQTGVLQVFVTGVLQVWYIWLSCKNPLAMKLGNSK